jgi:hypothetical protein
MTLGHFFVVSVWVFLTMRMLPGTVLMSRHKPVPVEQDESVHNFTAFVPVIPNDPKLMPVGPIFSSVVAAGTVVGVPTVGLPTLHIAPRNCGRENIVIPESDVFVAPKKFKDVTFCKTEVLIA